MVRRCSSRSHGFACPCRAVGVSSCASCPAPRACGEHGTRTGAPEAGVARPQRSRPRLGGPVATFPRRSALTPSGRQRPFQASGESRPLPAEACRLCVDAGGSRGCAAGAPRASAGSEVVRGLGRQSAVCVSHGCRDRGPQHQPALTCQARLPCAQRSGPHACPGVARQRWRPRASGDPGRPGVGGAAGPNKGLQATPNSLRSSLAPALGRA